MDSKILFDKIDNCFIKFRNLEMVLRISGEKLCQKLINQDR